MNLKVTFGEKSSSFDIENTNVDRKFSASIGELNLVHDGQNGATFTPSVSEDGVLSWTNDRGLENPEPVNLKGKDGINGKDGTNGKDGRDGYTPVKGKDYFDGKDGANGKDGYTPVKGVDYFDGVNGKDGKDGVNGKDGYTPVKGVDYFDGKDGVDGKNGTNGKDGVNGKDGADGKTPIKGTDYFTETDKSEMVSAVIAALPVYDGEVTAV